MMEEIQINCDDETAALELELNRLLVICDVQG